MTLTVVELFAGIGGFSVGFERAGAKTVAAVEIDAKAREVFSKNFPDAAIFEDVMEVGGRDLLAAGFIPDRGIITAGWPCQDISVAGRGEGLAGERSGLFSEIVRLLEEIRPKWFVLENVPRLLSINGGRDMGAVVGSLAECGYGLSWRVLDASGFGVPQRRRRIFFVGCLGDSGAASGQVLFEPESVPGDSPQSRQPESETTSEVENCPRTSVSIVGALNTMQRGTPDTDSVAGGQLVVETHHISTLQGGGKRGYRIDAEAAVDCVAALTANGVGTCGADDNQAQAGHLIAFRNSDLALREVD